MNSKANPGYYSGPGVEPGRNKDLSAVDAEGPDNCYGCGAGRGTPHSPLCKIYGRGDQAWAQEEASKSDMIEHAMVSVKGQRGWRKRDDD